MRIGIGYDVHKFGYNETLILGGTLIPYEKGLIAHSDGDCLIHAIIDAILGACGFSDIGSYFPDTNSEFKNISSIKLLSKVIDIIEQKNYKIINIDSIIICELPKMKPYITSMKENLSKVLKLNISDIGIKATTEEGLGFTGKKEGIACQAICLVEKNKEKVSN